jgi:hypothetical protein
MQTTQEIKGQIAGKFCGAEGASVYKLTNGQVWKQSEYLYHYHYAFMPRVRIVPDGTQHKMFVCGMERVAIPVEKDW